MEHTHTKSYVEQAIRVMGACDPGLRGSWERIVVPAEIKERLLNHALMAIELRRNGVASIGLPLHGLLLLSGRPGVGKTSLARGLGSQIAGAIGNRYGPVRVLDVNLHVLPSELLGRTQRNIVQLFEEELPALVEEGPVVVVLDEVEAMAVSRAQTSLEINPADVFRGTAAFLSALDWVARELPGAIVVGTTNLPGAVDDAIASRADLWEELPLPTVEVIGEILLDTFEELSRAYPGCRALADPAGLRRVAGELAGMDGRQVRKFVADSLARRTDTAVDPTKLTMAALVEFAVATEESRCLVQARVPAPSGAARPGGGS